MHRLLVHLDQLSIHHNLVELSFHRRDELVQNISKREVGAVALEKRAANLIETCAVKNQLRSKNADGVGNIGSLNIRKRHWCWRWSGQRYLDFPALRPHLLHQLLRAARRSAPRCSGGVSKYPGAL